MGIIQNIMNKLRRGGAMVGVVQSLGKVTEHPKIAIDSREYDRIEENLNYFKGDFPKIKYHNTDGKIRERPYISLNMAKIVSHRLASIIFNEQMEFSINGNKEADKFARETLTGNSFLKNFEVYLESGLALGGLAMRPYYDGKKIDISYVQASVFYPLKSNTNDVTECAIATKTARAKGNKTVYYTLLEFHEWSKNEAGEEVYIITNELYQSVDNKDVVGVRVPLNTAYEDLQDQAVFTNLTRPQFVYLKPFGMNNKDITSPLGLSIYDNARNTLKQINDTYDQFNWEVQMGQRRVSVPSSVVSVKFDDNNGRSHQFFDSDQNVFINASGDMDDSKIVDLTTPIRSDDYIKAMNQFLKTLEMEVGLSTGSFSFDGQGLKTATEVVSENSMTYQTRNSHLSNVERAIKELIISILELAQGTITKDGKELYTGEIPALDDIVLDFDDGVFLDKNSQLDYWTKAAAAGLVSKQFATKRALDLTDDQIKEVMAQLKEEQQPQISPADALIYGDR